MVEKIPVPVPDRIEVDSDLGDTTITLTYTNPFSERVALEAAKDLVEAHRIAKSSNHYRDMSG